MKNNKSGAALPKDYRVEAEINFGIFPVTARFIYQFEYEEVLQIYKEHGNKDYVDCWKQVKHMFEAGHKWWASKYTSKRGVSMYFIVFRDRFLFNDMSYIILAHEVLHLIQFFDRDAFDRTKEFECEAYLHSHLMKQCMDAIRGENAPSS